MVLKKMKMETTSVVRNILVQASPEKVWNALTVVEERNKWETKSCSLDIRVGGQVHLEYGWGVTSSGTIIELIPHKKMVIENSEGNLAIWTLTEEGNSTRVSLEYTGLWVGDEGHMAIDNMSFGTQQFLNNMKSYFDNGVDLRDKYWSGWLAISHMTIRENHYDKYGVEKGSLVLGVKKDSTTYNVLHAGDVIISANGHTVDSYEDLESIVFCMAPGEKITLELYRNKDIVSVEVSVLSYPMPFSA